MAKVMTYKHNRTLDKMILVTAALLQGNAPLAEKTLTDLMDDQSGDTQNDLEDLVDLQDAALNEELKDAPGPSDDDDEEKEDDEETSSDTDPEDQDMNTDDDLFPAAASTIAKIRASRAAKVKAAKATVAKSEPAKKTLYAKKVVANLLALQKKTRVAPKR
jgi:hypothetical protein